MNKFVYQLSINGGLLTLLFSGLRKATLGLINHAHDNNVPIHPNYRVPLNVIIQFKKHNGFYCTASSGLDRTSYSLTREEVF